MTRPDVRLRAALAKQILRSTAFLATGTERLPGMRRVARQTYVSSVSLAAVVYGPRRSADPIGQTILKAVAEAEARLTPAERQAFEREQEQRTREFAQRMSRVVDRKAYRAELEEFQARRSTRKLSPEQRLEAAERIYQRHVRPGGDRT